MLEGMVMGLASTVWSTVSGVTREAAKAGLLKSAKLDSRVISVGNIQVGGAGKTPLVAQIAREADRRGLSVCILSRGYRGGWETTGGILMPGEDPVNAAQSGDEPALLHELCPNAYIGIGANRLQQYRVIQERMGSTIDLVILDDGFQNWRIHKDIEVVALTSSGSGKSRQLLFRDSPTALRYADLIVWTKGEVEPDAQGKPVVRVRYRLPQAEGKESLWLVTGIADGQHAYTLALQSGYRIQRYISLMDHVKYDRSYVELLLKQASAVQCRIAMTGKDWVKWRDLGIARQEVVVLEPELIFEQGKELWTRTLWGE